MRRTPGSSDGEYDLSELLSGTSSVGAAEGAAAGRRPPSGGACDDDRVRGSARDSGKHLYDVGKGVRNFRYRYGHSELPLDLRARNHAAQPVPLLACGELAHQ